MQMYTEEWKKKIVTDFPTFVKMAAHKLLLHFSNKIHEINLEI